MYEQEELIGVAGRVCSRARRFVPHPSRHERRVGPGVPGS